MKPLKLFFTLLLFVSIVTIFGCAGKQLQQKSARFVPENKKNIYIGSILNRTTEPFQLETSLTDFLTEYYRYSLLIKQTPSFSEADLYLQVQINNFVYSEIFATKYKLQKRTFRFYITFSISLKDIKTKETIILDKSLHLPYIVELEDYEYNLLISASLLPERVKTFFFTILAQNIDNLITNGTMISDEKIGFEGLDDKKSTFPQFGAVDNVTEYNNYEQSDLDPEFQEKISLTNFQGEINKRNQLGSKAYEELNDE